jgi:TonB family protein
MRISIIGMPTSWCLRLLCIAALSLAAILAFAQDIAPAKDAPAMPKYPKALMLLAAKSNGLSGDDIKPWHLKVSYQLLDDRGSVKEKGTYEEFWGSPTRYKKTYTDASSTETYYGTENSVLRSGSLDSDLEPITLIQNEIVSPIPINGQIVDHFVLGQQKLDKGGAKLICDGTMSYTGPGQTSHFAAPTYCFDPNLPAVRLSVRWGDISQFVHNNIVSFQGRYLPGDLIGLQRGKTVLTAHLDTIETLNPIRDADFTPTPDALPWPPLETISSAAAQQLEIQQVTPIYPPIARAAHVQGTVVLRAIIGKNGRVLSLGVISGPAMLQQATLDAVKKWTYKPYLLNNKPTDVNATINVVFSLWKNPHAVP